MRKGDDSENLHERREMTVKIKPQPLPMFLPLLGFVSKTPKLCAVNSEKLEKGDDSLATTEEAMGKERRGSENEGRRKQW